ncbi:MAG: hypothetical protein IKC77_09010, partial [Lentisphaeria bacterium]|nr:hypothetical protein [Lentisphaeria bacterium]
NFSRSPRAPLTLSRKAGYFYALFLSMGMLHAVVCADLSRRSETKPDAGNFSSQQYIYTEPKLNRFFTYLNIAFIYSRVYIIAVPGDYCFFAAPRRGTTRIKGMFYEEKKSACAASAAPRCCHCDHDIRLR